MRYLKTFVFGFVFVLAHEQPRSTNFTFAFDLTSSSVKRPSIREQITITNYTSPPFLPFIMGANHNIDFFYWLFSLYICLLSQTTLGIISCLYNHCMWYEGETNAHVTDVVKKLHKTYIHVNVIHSHAVKYFYPKKTNKPFNISNH